MATLAGQMTMLRDFAPHWSAVFLAASLLFCTAILVQPLTTKDLKSIPPVGQIAEPRTKTLEPIASVGKAVPRHDVREDALVVRVSAGAR
jgi:hypothetical protein